MQREPGALRDGGRAGVAAAVRRDVRARALPVRRRGRRDATTAGWCSATARRPRRRGPRHRHADGRAARQAAAGCTRDVHPRRAATAAARPRPASTCARPRIAVLRHPTVACKRFLITIGDRTVGGLTHRDQMVGPVAGAGGRLRGHAGRLRRLRAARRWPWASARRSPRSTRRPPAAWRSARRSPTCWPRRSTLDARQAQSCNWMAACGEPGEDAALYDTVKAVGDGAVPGARASACRSARTRCRCAPAGPTTVRRSEAGDRAGVACRHARSPTLRRRARHAHAAAARRRHDAAPRRPRRRPRPPGRLDPGAGARPVRRRGARPRRPERCSSRWSPRSTELRAAGWLLAYHDRSDGGLWAAACEMAFAGHLGVSLNVDLLVTEATASPTAAPSTATRRTGPAGERRRELTLRRCSTKSSASFAGATALRDEAASAHGRAAQPPSASRPARCASRSGATPSRCSASRCATCTRPGTRSAGASPRCATTRPAPTPSTTRPARDDDPGLHRRTVASTRPTTSPRRTCSLGARPKVAILREQGVNSHVEMSYAFDRPASTPTTCT